MSKKGKRCKLPAIFGLQKWFEQRFADICHIHDKHYGSVHPKTITRKEADKLLREYMITKGYFTLGWLTYGFLRAFGWLWYMEYKNPAG